ncbi:hypothetical protein GCM10023116_28960 [Kistimonas scapharcae]|uniref:Uncharacterized protein n=1 Tax=Kistimonas scapharcae TaxID=1036133 RepID=A0ABP8V302_9GAMM
MAEIIPCPASTKTGQSQDESLKAQACRNYQVNNAAGVDNFVGNLCIDWGKAANYLCLRER